MENMKIRVFGAKECEKCQAIIKAFEYHSLAIEYIDANAEENELLCDQNKVEELPHVQAIYEDNGKVFMNHIGYISPLDFIDQVKEYLKKMELFFGTAKHVADKNVDKEAIKKVVNEPQRKPGCSTCSKKRNVKS